MRLSFLRFAPIIIVSVLCNYGCATDEAKLNKVGQASQALIDEGGGCGGGGGIEDSDDWIDNCGGGDPGGGDPGCDGLGGVVDACGVCNGDGTTCGGCDGKGGVVDTCGVCNGDGTSCLRQQCIDRCTSSVQPILAVCATATTTLSQTVCLQAAQNALSSCISNNCG